MEINPTATSVAVNRKPMRFEGTVDGLDAVVAEKKKLTNESLDYGAKTVQGDL